MYRMVKEIPMPEGAYGGTYPFRQCEIGDGFDVPEKMAKSVRSTMSRLKKVNKLVFISRALREGDSVDFPGKGIRIKRVA